MNKRLTFIYFCLFSFLQIAAQEGAPFVTTSSKKLDKQWVGQKLDFYVELHSPTWFSGTPRFDIPEMKDAVIFKIPGSPVLGNLEKDGQSYTKQIHSFAIFTRRPGRVTIPAFNVQYGIARTGKDPERVTLKSKPLTLETQVPKELMGKIFIVSENYSLKEHWDKTPDSHSFKVGDSLKRTITQAADNNLSMILPPIIIQPTQQFLVYPDKAKLKDSMVRGDFSAQRIDSCTYLFKEETELTLPEIKISSFNPKNEEITEHKLDAVKLAIAPNPLYQEETTDQAMVEEKMKPWWFALILIPLLALIIFRKQVQIRFQIWNQERKESEAYLFAEFAKKAPHLSPQQVYLEADLWVKKLGFSSVAKLIESNSNPSLKDQFNALNQELFTAPKSAFDTQVFIGELRKSRKAYLKNKSVLHKQKKSFLDFA
ncbi:hypothetical protein LNTAR_23614 [Lentisphaera araneosa HTCC2155]|jgi:hypothetical protein|uniref:BatD n=1 Tax=Lentisphaera araneosa HTCC2155 TaxID=313628 RepID=A6DS50_9BACT|nr:BatD family protein [Lentisphaera araneosa]EDM25510.1 hypothetical protein LNTAR_23614 [Lentisphaera araneosa HTCC2155]